MIKQQYLGTNDTMFIPALITAHCRPALGAGEEAAGALLAQTVAQVDTVVQHHAFLVVEAVGFLPVGRV